MNISKRKFISEENTITNVSRHIYKKSKSFVAYNYENYIDVEQSNNYLGFTYQNDLELENIGKKMSRNKKF